MATNSPLPPEIYAAAERGWRMFPVKPKGKLPLIPEWPAKASSDLGALEAWAMQNPGCNWGLATGKPSGVFVVDVDGAAGRASVAELEREGLKFPSTLTVTTGRADGGTHLYFRLPEAIDVNNDQNGRIGPHIDVRGTGGFVVGPPSIHVTGKAYQCVDPSAAIADAPAWVIERLTSRTPHDVPPAAKTGEPTVSKGERTKRLVSLAGTMHKRGMSPAAIEQALLAENAASCDPPLPAEKVRAIARDIPKRYPNDSAGAPSDPQTTVRKRASVVCLADVVAKPVSWLWEPYIPIGMVSMISGDPGAGKSYVAEAIAADVTRGTTRAGLRYEPGGVLYMTLENPLAEVMRPRLDSLGGDANLFWVVNGTVYEDESGSDDRGIITFSDLDLLDEIIQSKNIRMVIIDPLTSFFSEGKSMNHSTDTRPVFDRLAQMAEQHNLAVLVIRHNNKQMGGKSIYRGGGSIDMTGAVRSEMLAAVSPDNPEQRALAHIKTNIGPQGRTQGYVIEPDGQGGARFAWTGELAVTAEELNAAPEAPETRTKQDEAREWLVELLRGGSLSQKEVQGKAEASGLKWRTVRRAKDDCSAVKSRKTSMTTGWIWYLAEDPHIQMNQAPPKSSENGRLVI